MSDPRETLKEAIRERGEPVDPDRIRGPVRVGKRSR